MSPLEKVEKCIFCLYNLLIIKSIFFRKIDFFKWAQDSSFASVLGEKSVAIR